MADKIKEKARIESIDCLAPGIYSICFKTGIAKLAKAGQFIAVYSNDKSRMLPRPISLCEIDRENEIIRIVFRIAGAGTEEFSKAKAGDYYDIMGPLGNGFPEVKGSVTVIGGGIGIPPMLEAAKSLEGCKVNAVLGYRDNNEFLKEDFINYANVYIATEDGSDGVKGNVLNAMDEYKIDTDYIFACGPTPMLRAIKEYAKAHDIKCYISLEERMGCGIGACLACVCKTKNIDSHSNVNNTRICKEGPVFAAEEVEI